MIRSSAKILTVLLTVSLMVAFQGDPWIRQVRAQLRLAEAAMDLDEFRPTHQILTGALDDGAYRTTTATLQAYTTYQIIGVCDDGCDDLDLQLYNPSGTMVDSDYADDDTPIVTVRPLRTGVFRVRAYMASCYEEPCRYGIGIYGR